MMSRLISMTDMSGSVDGARLDRRCAVVGGFE